MKFPKIDSILLASSIACAIVGFPLISFLPDAIGVDSRNATIIFRLVYLLLSIMIIIRSFLFKKFNSNQFLVVFILFWILYSIRLLYDIQFKSYELVVPAEEYLFFCFGATLIPSISLFYKYDSKIIDFSSIFLFILLFVTNLLILNGSLKNLNIESSSGTYSNSRMNYIMSGTMGVLLSIYALLKILLDSTQKSIIQYLIYLISFILGMAVISLSGSRGVFASVLVQMLIIFSLGFITGNSKKAMGLFAIFGVLILLNWNLISSIFELTIIRFEIGLNEREYGNEVRTNYASAGIEAFLENPIFGVGLINPKTEDHPHNQIIDGFTSTGIIGGLLNLVLIIAGIFFAYRIIKRRTKDSWVSFMFLSALIGALSSGTIYLNGFFYCMLVLVISLNFSYKIKNSNE